MVDVENVPHQPRVLSHTVAESDGERKNPLATGNWRLFFH
jgi:hypothetical protein